MVGYSNDKDKLALRLKKIEGQIRGIRRMIEDDKYCINVLNQISAVKGGLKKVELKILEDHTRGCIKNAMENGSKEAKEDKIDELIKIINRLI